MYFDRSLELARMTDDQLLTALDEALAQQDSKLVWRLVDELERRNGRVEL
ncbi:hypothetical protein [Sphingomonas oryzagri]